MISGVFTIAAFLGFIGVTWWAYTRHNRTRFEEAAALPLIEDDLRLSQSRVAKAPCCQENAK